MTHTQEYGLTGKQALQKKLQFRFTTLKTSTSEEDRINSGFINPFFRLGQKGLFIGMYNNMSNEDTTVRVFMSYDSVKLISTTRIRNGDMWLQLKCGTWAIKRSYNPDEGGYTITFRFNNGTSQDVIFKASYLEPFTEQRTAPDFYTLCIGYMNFEKIFGKGSIMERDIFNIKTIYGK